MLIQCLIERDGDTTITRGGVNYVFRHNRQGHAVCEVQNDDHARIFLRMGSTLYRPYGANAEQHALRMKMIKKEAIIDELDDDGELFEEAVGIVEGREASQALPLSSDPQEELFSEVESAEEALADLPNKETVEADPLVKEVALRMLSGGNKKPYVAEKLQRQFGLTADDAKRIVSEVAKK